MDFAAFLKGPIMDYEIGFGFYTIGLLFKLLPQFLCIFLFFGFGMKLLCTDRFVRVLFRFVCDSREESRNGFCSDNAADGDKKGMLLGIPNPDTDLVDRESDFDFDSDDEFDDAENYEDDESWCKDENLESDLWKAREISKIERRRANAALAELAKERAASASAAEEAMAMILRLQNEKSLIELESSQFKRLAEEKQIHDQEVIRSLQWLVWRHESERSLLEDQLKYCRQELKLCSSAQHEEDEEARMSSFNGNILDALENVLYSSRDANLLSP
ncbi:Protein of unknown function- DUF593 [Striga hermonthica]|uniref:GTD-binding domain-containing protein n=1 Tax=Striga hermonthica TaxID=68872 RepID=A0A9N7MKJ6_STRHE|nr:Protein of unknown function- DUF593 [Striga hermonthica]